MSAVNPILSGEQCGNGSLPFPDLKTVVNLFGALVGKAVAARPMRAAPVTASSSAPLFVGYYTPDDEETPTAAMIFDLPVALALSGALSAFPPAIILDELKRRQITDVLRTNMVEIMNITASLFNATGAPHLRMRRVSELLTAPNGDLPGLLSGANQRLDLEVTLPPCPAGRVVIVRRA